jgi:hypothetical protein
MPRADKQISVTIAKPINELMAVVNTVDVALLASETRQIS